MKDKRKSGGEGFEENGATLANPRKGRKGRGTQGQSKRAMAEDMADMTRGAALPRLFVKGSIDREMFVAGAQLRQLWISKTPGMSAIDFTRERVDGGKRSQDPSAGMSVWDEQELKQLILRSGMGIEAASVLRMVCLLDMMPTQVAVEMEQDESVKRLGQCRRETRGMVMHLMRSGLKLTWAAMNDRQSSDEALKYMQEWLRDGGPGAYAEQAAMKARARGS